MIAIIDGAFSAELCTDLIQELDTHPAAHRVDEGYRRCRRLFMTPSSLLDRVFEALRVVRTAYGKLHDPHGHLAHVGAVELPAILRYEPAEDRFNRHSDNWNVPSALRQVSIIVYLNDCQGGRTVFAVGQSIDPKLGRALIFPAFFTHPHYAEPPVGGPKYALVTWFCYPPTGEAPYATTSL